MDLWNAFLAWLTVTGMFAILIIVAVWCTVTFMFPRCKRCTHRENMHNHIYPDDSGTVIVEGCCKCKCRKYEGLIDRS